MANTSIPITKIHSYNVSVAADVGINAAVVFYNICFWVEENHANKRNFINGKYWTYNTVKALHTIFPEMTGKQIEYALKKLKDGGYIESAILSEDTRDRTNWYTVCDFKKWILHEEPTPQEKEAPNEKREASSENSEMPSDDSVMFNNIYNNINTGTDNKQSNNNQTDNKPTDNSHNNSFSKEKDLQSNSPEGERSNSFSREKKTATSNKTKRRSEKEMEDMVNQIPLRARQIAYEMTGDTNKAARIYECVDYFLGKHKEYSKERHKVLKDETLRKIVFKLIGGIKIERDGYTDVYDGLASTSEFVGDYQDVIDEYFNTNFKGQCDYSLVHFSGDMVLINMMNHVCKEEWCESM